MCSTGTEIDGAGLWPAEEAGHRHSPLRRYPWAEAYPALQRLMARDDEGHGVRLEYRNPVTGWAGAGDDLLLAVGPGGRRAHPADPGDRQLRVLRGPGERVARLRRPAPRAPHPRRRRPSLLDVAPALLGGDEVWSCSASPTAPSRTPSASTAPRSPNPARGPAGGESGYQRLVGSERPGAGRECPWQWRSATTTPVATRWSSTGPSCPSPSYRDDGQRVTLPHTVTLPPFPGPRLRRPGGAGPPRSTTPGRRGGRCVPTCWFVAQFIDENPEYRDLSQPGLGNVDGMSDQDTLLRRLEDGVLTLTLNRPDRLNALKWAMVDGLTRGVADAGRDPEVRVIVVTGAGRAFCSGDDIVGGMGDRCNEATPAASPPTPTTAPTTSW